MITVTDLIFSAALIGGAVLAAAWAICSCLDANFKKLTAAITSAMEEINIGGEFEEWRGGAAGIEDRQPYKADEDDWKYNNGTVEDTDDYERDFELGY